MRVLHTADWHFGRLLEGRDRRQEQEAFVTELCAIADERNVDVVLIAGDVYDSVNPPAWAEELFYEALERLSNNGKRGVVVIAGNHDQPERVRAAAPLAHKARDRTAWLAQGSAVLHGAGHASRAGAHFAGRAVLV
ncbi:UNVERIFIED_CONTAM: exonuclease SbcD [Brevibacillus sp. OAP136]